MAIRCFLRLLQRRLSVRTPPASIGFVLPRPQLRLQCQEDVRIAAFLHFFAADLDSHTKVLFAECLVGLSVVCTNGSRGLDQFPDVFDVIDRNREVLDKLPHTLGKFECSILKIVTLWFFISVAHFHKCETLWIVKSICFACRSKDLEFE